jgi:uncharacterized protein with gpF-like domain
MARRLLDRSKRREAQRQAVLLDRLAAQFRGRLRAELSTAMREMVEHWELTREVMMPRGFRDRIEATYQQMAVAAVTAFGGRIFDQGKAAGLVLERKEDFAQTMTRLALRYIAQEAVRRRITDVTETTRRQIVNAIDAGYNAGVGTSGVAGFVLDAVGHLSTWRAEMIARTETHGAANFGSNEAARETGLPLKREWLAAADERTRPSHVVAGQQPPIGMDDAFQVGDASMMYPGDPAGPAEEVINCRCTLGYIVDDGI